MSPALVLREVAFGDSHCRVFFPFYNDVHRHSGLAMLTPADVHYGRAAERIAARAATMNAAYLAHPERFPHGPPTPHLPPTQVWINKPIQLEVEHETKLIILQISRILVSNLLTSSARAPNMNGQIHMSKVKEYTPESLADLIAFFTSDAIAPARPTHGGHRRSFFIFRGMSDSNWSLETTLQRLGSDPRTVEHPLLRNFEKYAPRGHFTNASIWEILAVAQHNGLPTRCLDWTASPLVATFFATVESKHHDKDGVIWSLNLTEWRNKRYPNMLSERLRDPTKKAWTLDINLLKSCFSNMDEFDEFDKGATHLIAFEPPSIDARIQNQYGILTILNGADKSHDELLSRANNEDSELVKKIVIPARLKQSVQDFLGQSNINERTLFPGLPGTAEWLRRYYSPASPNVDRTLNE